MDFGFALAVQGLSQATAKVLVLCQLAGYRNQDRWFKLSDIDQMFEDLRVPRPDVRRALRQLTETEMVMRARDAERWSLTPMGDRRVSDLVGALDLARLEPQLERVSGADFGHTRHTVIPPALAPVQWQDGIHHFLERFPFETNVFCMTRFPSDEKGKLPDPVAGILDVVKAGIEAHGLVLHLASDRQIDDDLWGNVAAHAWACCYGIGLFEDRMGDGINDNLIIEIGSMLMTGRRCALLKDKSAPSMPTDLVGQIYKPVDFDNPAGVAVEVHRWAAEDLGLGRCSRCSHP